MTIAIETNQTLAEYYTAYEVWPRFMFRYFKRSALTKKLSQREIYSYLEAYTREKNLPLQTTHALGKYLSSLNGLLSHRSTGNQRWWYGIETRDEIYRGKILVDGEHSEEFLSWVSEDFIADSTEDSDRYLADGEPREPGRPHKHEEIPLPARKETFGKIKGVRWSRLYRFYKKLELIPRFEKEHLVADPESVVRREELWREFDKFCQRENVPTCSAIRLCRQLRLARRLNLDGTEDWIGVKITKYL